MSEEIAAANANLTEIARLRTALAQANAELEAARAVIIAARIASERSLFPGRGRLMIQIYAYDAIVKREGT